MLYAAVAELPLEVEDLALTTLKLATSAGWERHTTVVHLRGRAIEGSGEDVTYENDCHAAFLRDGAALDLAGSYTLAEFSRHLDRFELFATVQPADPAARLFRRWAFESAALDLALRQANTDLGAVLGRSPAPMRYGVSLGLGEPPTLAPIERVLAVHEAARFKIDLSESWTRSTVEQLAALGRVDVVDLKGHYRGAFRGPAANPEQYAWVAELLPEAWLEDPWLDERTAPALGPHQARITWDATLHSLADLIQVAPTPRCVNIKPSRFGTLEELLRVHEFCEQRGIAMYAGGQFELGPGRGQIQELASLFHPDAPNDAAPSAFNDAELRSDLLPSPLTPPADHVGFGW